MPTISQALDDAHAAYLIARIRDLTARTLRREPIHHLGATLDPRDASYYPVAIGALTYLADAAAEQLERKLREQEAAA